MTDAWPPQGGWSVNVQYFWVHGASFGSEEPTFDAHSFNLRFQELQSGRGKLFQREPSCVKGCTISGVSAPTRLLLDTARIVGAPAALSLARDAARKETV